LPTFFYPTDLGSFFFFEADGEKIPFLVMASLFKFSELKQYMDLFYGKLNH